MIAGALGDRLQPSCDGYLAMFHEDAAIDFPSCRAGRWAGRASGEWGKDLATLQGGVVFEVFAALVHARDGRWRRGDVVVMEYRCRAHEPASGAPYPQAYVAVMRMVDGRLSFFRESFNPLLNLALSGRTAAQATAAGRPWTHPPTF